MQSDGDKTEGEEEEEDSDGEKSDDSGFGFEKKKKGKSNRANKAAQSAAPRRLRGKTTPPPLPAPAAAPEVIDEGATADNNSQKPASRSSGSSNKNPDRVMSVATQILNNLRQLTPASVWLQKGVGKMRDLDSKITKALDYVSRLEGFEGNKSCEDLAKELAPIAKRLGKWQDLAGRFKGEDVSVMRLLANFQICHDHLANSSQELSEEALRTVLTDLGKLLVEVGLGDFVRGPGCHLLGICSDS